MTIPTPTNISDIDDYPVLLWQFERRNRQWIFVISRLDHGFWSSNQRDKVPVEEVISVIRRGAVESYNNNVDRPVRRLKSNISYRAPLDHEKLYGAGSQIWRNVTNPENPLDIWIEGWEYWGDHGVPGPLWDMVQDYIFPEADLILNSGFARKLRTAVRDQDYEVCEELLTRFFPENADDKVIISSLEKLCSQLESRFIRLETRGETDCETYQETAKYLEAFRRFQGKDIFGRALNES